MKWYPWRVFAPALLLVIAGRVMAQPAANTTAKPPEEAALDRGILHAVRGDFELAVVEFTGAIQRNGNLAADHTQAIRLDPNDAGAYYNRGGAYLVTRATMTGPSRTEAQNDVVKSDGTKSDAFKQKKLEALQRWKAKKATAAKKAYEDALKLRDELVKAGLFDKLTPESKNYVLSLVKDPTEKRASSFGGSSVFDLIFGDNPKVGDTVTLREAFDKTYKGKSTLDVWVRRWAERGQVVEVKVNKENMMATTYTIKQLAS
jgi:hypothetical protein